MAGSSGTDCGSDDRLGGPGPGSLVWDVRRLSRLMGGDAMEQGLAKRPLGKKWGGPRQSRS